MSARQSRHLEILHAAMTGCEPVEMYRYGHWQPVRVVELVQSPFITTDEPHYIVHGLDFLDYVSLSESTRLLRIVRS